MENVIIESKSSYDKVTKQKMLFVFAIMSITSLIFLFISVKYVSNAIIGFWSILILYMTLMIVGFLNTPFKYYLTSSKLYIKRPKGIIRIDLNEVKEIREFTKDDKLGLIRVFGAEGLFGSFGRYSSKKHKSFDLYASRDTNWIMIELKSGKKYVISPDNINIIEKTKELMQKSNVA